MLNSEDGKYSWTYVMNLYRYPKALFKLLKIFGWLYFIFFLFLIFINAMTRDIEAAPPQETLLFCLLLYACCAILLTFFYYLIALFRGGKKKFSYEMDERGIARVRGEARTRTEFCKIRKIRTKEKRCEITLKSRVTKKRIYVPKEDYETVLSYIKEKTGK